MKNSRITVSILNQLVKLHYDRIEGYKVASRALKAQDEGLSNLFQSLHDESRNFILELSEQICCNGGSVSNDTTTIGKVYRSWMRLKIALYGVHNVMPALDSCRLGEYALQKAYETALYRRDEISEDVYQMIEAHEITLKKSYWVLRSYSDKHLVSA